MGKTVTNGSAPAGPIPVDRATNRSAGYSYDANGNQTSTNAQSLYCDYESRVNLANTWSDETRVNYGYDPDNRRVLAMPGTYGGTVYFWGADGRRVGSYGRTADAGTATMRFATTGTRRYFGGKLVWNEAGTVQEDRLGSIPWAIGLDYFAARYFSGTQGRFTSPDKPFADWNLRSAELEFLLVRKKQSTGKRRPHRPNVRQQHRRKGRG